MGREVGERERERGIEKMQSTKRHNRTDEIAVQKMSRKKSKHKMNETEMKSNTFLSAWCVW